MRNAIFVPDALLVSSPNGGGLALVDGHVCLRLSDQEATGIAVDEQSVRWCLQEDGARAVREFRDGQIRTRVLSEAMLDLHDILVDGDAIFAAATQTNEVLALDAGLDVVERWAIGGTQEDACHVNCLAVLDGALVASIFGRFETNRGYKGNTRGAGEIVDVRSGATLLAGLSQPHSLVVEGDRLWLCNSEEKQLRIYEGERLVRTVQLPGYTRGLALGESHVYVGLSCSRNLEVESQTGYFESGAVMVLRRDDLSPLGAIQLPWREVYDIRVVPDRRLLQALVAANWEHERRDSAERGTRAEAAIEHATAAQLDALRQERDQAALDAQAARAEVARRTAELEAQLDALRGDVQVRTLQLADLHTSHAQADAQVIRAKAEIDARDTRLGALQAARDGERARLEEEVRRLEALSAEQRGLAEQWSRQLVEAGRERESLVQELARRAGGMEALERDMERLRADMSGAVAEIERRDAEIAMLEAEVKAASDSLSDAQIRWSQEVRQLTEAAAAQRELLEGAHAATNAAREELGNAELRWTAHVQQLTEAFSAEREVLADAQAAARAEAEGHARLASDLARRVTHLQEAEREFELVKRSRSWRLTKPLRFAMRLLRNRGLQEDDRQRLGELLGRAPRRRLVAPVQTREDALPAPAPAEAAPALPVVRSLATRLVRRDDAMVVLADRSECEEDVFVWAVIDWHFRIQRPQHMARELAATGRRVFYISNNFIDSPEPGFKVEPLDEGGRLFQVFLNVLGKPPIYFTPPDGELQGRLDASVRSLLQWTRSQRTVSLVQHPFWSAAARIVPNHRLVYDCMDHHGGFEDNAHAILALEEGLMRNADLLVVSSAWLDEEGARFNPRRALIRNAGQYEHFATRPHEVFVDLEGRRVIGYYGAIASWFDLDLVASVARSHPSCVVLLVGDDTCGARAALADVPNIVFTGEVPYAQLPYYLYGFDVCMLPFKVLPLTLATNPVKAYEYLAAGKPLVTVDLPEMHQFGSLVRICGDASAFVDAVSDALDEAPGDPVREARRDFAAGQTWARRADEMVTALAGIEEPRVSVVVLAYNNLDLTKACLASIEAHSDYPNLEVIVVDNASSDGTPEFLREWARGPGLRRVQLNPDNKGFAAGNNQGLALATGEYLVLLNNDTQVTPGWVRTLRTHLVRDPGIGIVGPVTNNIGNEARIEITYPDPLAMVEVAGEYTRRHAGVSIPIRTVAFFCVMLPRSTYERVGGLDEAFGTGFFEDDDYCRRVEAAGLSVACADDVFIHHHLSASFNQLAAERKQALFERNKVIYESKWGAWEPHVYRS